MLSILKKSSDLLTKLENAYYSAKKQHEKGSSKNIPDLTLDEVVISRELVEKFLEPQDMEKMNSIQGTIQSMLERIQEQKSSDNSE
jgi:hypothetical protein